MSQFSEIINLIENESSGLLSDVVKSVLQQLEPIVLDVLKQELSKVIETR